MEIIRFRRAGAGAAARCAKSAQSYYNLSNPRCGLGLGRVPKINTSYFSRQLSLSPICERLESCYSSVRVFPRLRSNLNPKGESHETLAVSHTLSESSRQVWAGPRNLAGKTGFRRCSRRGAKGNCK